MTRGIKDKVVVTSGTSFVIGHALVVDGGYSVR
jgi:hypothetical protein